MDESQLKKEGVYSIFNSVGARTEVPGCSLCMGNQARVEDKARFFQLAQEILIIEWVKMLRCILGLLN